MVSPILTYCPQLNAINVDLNEKKNGKIGNRKQETTKPICLLCCN